MLQQSEEAQYPVEPLSPLLNREAVGAANGWLARFAPLLDASQALGAQACRAHLEQLPALRTEGEAILANLRAQAAVRDAALLTTLAHAVGELDGIEGDLRRRLGLLAPGDPAAEVDLEQMQARLAEASARREVQSWAGTLPAAPPRLELTTTPGSVAGGLMLGVFSLGWLSFTTVHAVLMIGGMWMAFGPLALALVLFYSIFWTVGLGMAWGAWRTASREEIALEGRHLTIHRRLFGFSSKKEFTLAPDCRARAVEASVRQQGSAAQEISLQDVNGRDLRLAAGRPDYELERLIGRINEHLALQGSLERR